MEKGNKNKTKSHWQYEPLLIKFDLMSSAGKHTNVTEQTCLRISCSVEFSLLHYEKSYEDNVKQHLQRLLITYSMCVIKSAKM